MIEYIYFVKCPECEDEHFDFFDDAKAYALGCLTRKPIITQTEVCRNDFGECTDHMDLGTIWSWEDEMSDEEFQKPISLDCNLENFDEYDPETDAEFLNLDNEIETIIVKPVPDTMSIKGLVESLEENEEWVECKWCEELFPKEDCRYTVPLGYLCPQCVEAIKSRGEELTFRESLKESATEAAHKYLPGLPNHPEVAVAAIVEKVQKKYPALANFFNSDGTFNGLSLSARVGDRNRTTGKLLSFTVGATGEISVSYDRNYGYKGEPIIVVKDIDELRKTAREDSKKVLGAINNVVNSKESEGGLRPDTQTRRKLTTYVDLAREPEMAEELKQHIKNIQYIIPLVDEYSETFKVDKNNQPLTSKAYDKLQQICDRFMKEPFAEKALKIEGMVKNRPSTQDTNHNIERSWGRVAKVTFDVPISQLSEEAQVFIASTKIKGTIAADDTDRIVTNYYLPTALIRYFNNDPLFYEHLTEALEYKPDGTTNLEYKNFTIEVQGPVKDVDDWDIKEVTDDFEYPVSNNDLATTIWEQFITEEDVPAEFGSLTALEEDDNLWQEFLKEHFDDLVEKYNKELLDYYEDEAQAYFEEHYEYDPGYDIDRAYDEYRDRLLFDEAVTPTISEFTDSKAELVDCPECGDTKCFDRETGICNTCGFH